MQHKCKQGEAAVNFSSLPEYLATHCSAWPGKHSHALLLKEGPCEVREHREREEDQHLYPIEELVSLREFAGF